MKATCWNLDALPNMPVSVFSALMGALTKFLGLNAEDKSTDLPASAPTPAGDAPKG